MGPPQSPVPSHSCPTLVISEEGRGGELWGELGLWLCLEQQKWPSGPGLPAAGLSPRPRLVPAPHVAWPGVRGVHFPGIACPRVHRPGCRVLHLGPAPGSRTQLSRLKAGSGLGPSVGSASVHGG